MAQLRSRFTRTVRHSASFASSSSSLPFSVSPAPMRSLAASIACHRRALHFLDFAILRVEAGVAGRIRLAQVEHCHLCVEADRSAGNERFLVPHAGAVERVARSEVVGTIEHDVGGSNQGGQVVRQELFLQRNNINVGI